MFFDDDTKKLIEDSEFSESVIVEYESEDVETSGIYDDCYMEVDPNTGAKIMKDQPRLTLYYKDLLADHGEIIDGMYVQLPGRDNKRCRIVEPQVDGTGLIHLILKDA